MSKSFQNCNENNFCQKSGQTKELRAHDYAS